MLNLGIAFIPFFLSLYDYPVMTLFFMVFSAANILFSRYELWPQTRMRLFHEVLFCLVSMALYLISYKLIYLPLLLTLCPDLKNAVDALGYHSVQVSMDLGIKLRKVWAASIFSFGGIFHPFFGQISQKITVALLCLGNLILLKKGKLPLRFNWILQMILGMIIVILVTEGPILATGVGFIYRVVFPYAAIVVLMFFWLFQGLSYCFFKDPQKMAVRAALWTVLIFGILAEVEMFNTALSANRELNFIRQKVANMDFTKVKSIIVDRPAERDIPKHDDPLDPYQSLLPAFGDFPQRFEYDHMATNRTFIWEMVQAV
ncbi:MAG: hypothetical protein HQL13_01765 [Candidatus Omnitrophica bacterium]|nr:hypothetical protein [Candidatus Omnitrophota bacterium]